jgi:hypothetical protein
VIKHDERMTTNRGGSTHSVITGWHLRQCRGLVEVSSREQLRRLGQMAPAIWGRRPFSGIQRLGVYLSSLFQIRKGKADHKKECGPRYDRSPHSFSILDSQTAVQPPIMRSGRAGQRCRGT